ncbi:hypothetical protein NDU88_002820 [Pleurodeles waltl]|uniref:Uncharacterized protein n=1 Tax=Pleurodeles waltl TaxID=8319 RepID=A0AAV7LGZ9_PLEWA|nr:hypothetical protein NDU88_002820 [Pleurodeles waltl]
MRRTFAGLARWSLRTAVLRLRRRWPPRPAALRGWHFSVFEPAAWAVLPIPGALAAGEDLPDPQGFRLWRLPRSYVTGGAPLVLLGARTRPCPGTETFFGLSGEGAQ